MPDNRVLTVFCRAVLCKGAKYPPVLPRPTLLILPFQLPLCEVASDRGTLEVRLLNIFTVSDNFVHTKQCYIYCYMYVYISLVATFV